MNKQIKPIRNLPMESCAFHFSISPGGRSFALSNLLFKALYCLRLSSIGICDGCVKLATASRCSGVSARTLNFFCGFEASASGFLSIRDVTRGNIKSIGNKE